MKHRVGHRFYDNSGAILDGRGASDIVSNVNDDHHHHTPHFMASIYVPPK